MTSASRPSEPADLTRPRSAVPSADGTLVAGDGSRHPAIWRLADEAPLALLYNGESFGVMMVTPADLEDFVVGFSLTEGIVREAGEIDQVRVVPGGDGYLANVKLAAEIAESARDRRRSMLAGSSCGVCGAQTLEAALPSLPRVRGRWPSHDAVLGALRALPDHQTMNRLNRSTHAAGLAAPDGEVKILREDIGRHNALDKLAGAIAGKPRLEDDFLVLSSRLSIEMVVKAVRIGVPYVASVSAPSALALRKAGEAGLGVGCVAGDGLMEFGREST